MGDRSMSAINRAKPYVLTYLSEHGSGAISDMRLFVNDRTGLNINANAFYTIIFKIKGYGWIESLEERGLYRLTEKGAEQLIKYENSAKSDSYQDQKRSDADQGYAYTKISAEEAVRQMAGKLQVSANRNFLKENEILYAPWSVTPELAECIASLKIIEENFQKIDRILKEIDRDKKKF